MTIAHPVPGEAHAAAVDAVVGVPAVLPVPHQLARHPRHQQGCGQDHQTQSGEQYNCNCTCLVRYIAKKGRSFQQRKSRSCGFPSFILTNIWTVPVDYRHVAPLSAAGDLTWNIRDDECRQRELCTFDKCKFAGPVCVLQNCISQWTLPVTTWGLGN